MLPAVLGCALVLTGGCSGDRRAATPEATRAGTALLEVADLPDGYTVSPPQAMPEMSAQNTVSVEGCGPLLDRFRAGGGDGAATVWFEGGSTGPFLAEELSADDVELARQRDLARQCATFTETGADGDTTTVTVSAVADFPGLGDETAAFRMAASGGADDAAYTFSGYLVLVRLGATTCTLVHFGQPAVDRSETEAIAAAAVRKVRQRQ
ncbi:hypothetical protein GCM10010399_56250 [Dactylosporangium fulvum]